MERGVERVDRRLVHTCLEAAEQEERGVPRALQLRADVHAAAHIEQQRHTHRSRIPVEVDDPTRLATIQQLEVRLLQLGNRAAAPIPYDGAHRDEIHASPKRRLGVPWPALCRRGSGGLRAAADPAPSPQPSPAGTRSAPPPATSSSWSPRYPPPSRSASSLPIRRCATLPMFFRRVFRSSGL